MWQSFAQIAGDDTPNPLIDLFDALLGAHAEPRAGQQAKKKCRQQAQRERLTNHMRDLASLIDISSYYQHVAVWNAPGDGANDLTYPAVSIHLDDVGALSRSID